MIYELIKVNIIVSQLLIVYHNSKSNLLQTASNVFKYLQKCVNSSALVGRSRSVGAVRLGTPISLAVCCLLL